MYGCTFLNSSCRLICYEKGEKPRSVTFTCLNFKHLSVITPKGQLKVYGLQVLRCKVSASHLSYMNLKLLNIANKAVKGLYIRYGGRSWLATMAYMNLKQLNTVNRTVKFSHLLCYSNTRKQTCIPTVCSVTIYISSFNG